MKKKILIALGVLALVGAAIGTAFLVDGQLQFKITGEHEIFDLRGELAPQFEAKVVDEDRTLTLQDVRGKPTLLIFFSTFCPYCKAQMPDTKRAMEAIGDDANVLLANGREDPRLQIRHRDRLVSDYLERNDITGMTAVIAPFEMQEAFKLKAIPAIVVLDAEGRVTYTGLAHHDAEELEELVRDAM